ncbi:MAG TPA: transglycosylase SLT domain-containing protein [Blastocatellia bacterium]|nr:transglycosylase SLT domain-containing protein [Blastocatellia bacterium]
MQIRFITTLLIGAALMWLGGRLARRQSRSETFGSSLALCAVALGLALIPADWRSWLASGDAGADIGAFARVAGITGLIFLAGLRFEAEELWKTRRVVYFGPAAGALLFTSIAILLAMIDSDDRGAVIATAAAIVGTSLWLTGQRSLVSSREAIAAASARGSAAVLTILAALVVHIYSVIDAIPGARLTGTAYTVVILYELVKIALFFSLAWFITSKFLDRASGRVSPARALIGYLLMAALIFMLAHSVIGSLGALAWSFVAGAALSSSDMSRELKGNDQSVVKALFISFAFLPLLLQAHGRSLNHTMFVLAAVIAALAYKFVAVWTGARVSGASRSDARVIAAATLASGEVAVMLLGFGVTKWVIEGPFYFGILIYAFASTLLGQTLLRFFASSDKPEVAPADDQSPKGAKKSGVFTRGRTVIPAAIIAVSLAALGPTTLAQSSEDDPVKRAMERIESAVGERAVAADRALAASKLVNESAEARKRGDPQQAIESLEKAEKIAAESGSFERSALIDELFRLVAKERAALIPGPAPYAAPPANLALTNVIPKLALARYREYREPLGRILIEEKVPVELLAVALVESGFNPLALSPKGARGVWQFMPETAERYGLSVSATDDHRTHPEHSTRAAARYLRDLYRQFGDWKLALAAYNWGENRVRRIIERTGVRDFDQLARRGLLPLETRKYVPAVLAVWSQLGSLNMLTQQ